MTRCPRDASGAFRGRTKGRSAAGGEAVSAGPNTFGGLGTKESGWALGRDHDTRSGRPISDRSVVPPGNSDIPTR